MKERKIDHLFKLCTIRTSIYISKKSSAILNDQKHIKH
jgi:hypothetical protein